VNAPRVPFDRMSTLVASCFALNVAPTADGAKDAALDRA